MLRVFMTESFPQAKFPTKLLNSHNTFATLNKCTAAFVLKECTTALAIRECIVALTFNTPL